MTYRHQDRARIAYAARVAGVSAWVNGFLVAATIALLVLEDNIETVLLWVVVAVVCAAAATSQLFIWQMLYRIARANKCRADAARDANM